MAFCSYEGIIADFNLRRQPSRRIRDIWKPSSKAWPPPSVACPCLRLELIRVLQLILIAGRRSAAPQRAAALPHDSVQVLLRTGITPSTMERQRIRFNRSGRKGWREDKKTLSWLSRRL